MSEKNTEVLDSVGRTVGWLLRTLGEVKRLLFIAIAVAFIVMGNLPGRVIGIALLAILLWVPVRIGVSRLAKYRVAHR